MMIVADIVYAVPRKKEKIEGKKKLFFHVIGRAFIEDSKIDLKISSLPINFNGELTIYIK